MSYKYSFADNEVYSAEDVNKITKRLVTSGVAESFEDGIAYNVSRFNEMGKLLYTAGVVPDSCLTLKVERVNQGVVLINPGVAFFDDGATIEIEDGGEELTYVVGAVNYVYLKNDLLSANVCFPYCGTEMPEGDYVMLAVINENGVIEDKRMYAHGKLPGYVNVGYTPMFIKEKVELVLSDNHNAAGNAEFDIGTNNYEYVISIGKMGHYLQKESVTIYSIGDGKIVSLARKGVGDAFFDGEKMYLYYDRVHRSLCAIPSINDGVLSMKLSLCDYRDNLGNAGESIYEDVELILV